MLSQFSAMLRATSLLTLLVTSACGIPTQFTAAPADPGQTAHDPRFIGDWLWTKDGKLDGFARLRATTTGQVAIEFHHADGRVLELSAYAFEIEGTAYYVVTPDAGSYFRFFKKANDVPGYMLARIELVNDDEGFVWLSMWDPTSVPPGWPAKELNLAQYIGGVLVDVARDTLRAALRDNPYRVVNSRIGPYHKAPSGRQTLQMTSWLVDNRSRCAVGFPSHRLKERLEVKWSGSCHDGRANGNGLLELKVKDDISRYEGALVDGMQHGMGLCSDAKSSEWKTCQFEYGKEVKTAK